MRQTGLALMAAAVFLGESVASAGVVTLVAAGRPRSCIVLPAHPVKTEEFAAAELARYVAEASGAKLAILRQGAALPGGVPVFVGATPAGIRELPRGSAPAPAEAVFLRVGAGRVILCGGSPRGTLFAVYRFLEKCLGCRWLAPGIDFVPRKSTIALKPLREFTRPAFDMRLFIAERGSGAAACMDWGLKLGMNGFYPPDAAAGNGGCWYLPPELPGCHTYARVIPPEKYFASHPEWFPLIHGKRVPTSIHGRQLCVTAPGLADEFARRINEILDRHSDCRITSISPNDGRGWCECPACTALDRKLCGGRTTRQGLAGERPFRGDRVFWFANRVAERVARRHPETLLLELAYINYAEPPDTVRPRPNVVPWLCHYAPADYARSIADPASKPNAEFNALLRRWVRITPNILIYAYVSKSMWWRLPRPVLRPFAADVKYYRRLGIHRYYAQSRMTDWPLDGPLYYVLAKLLWDPGLDPQALAREWTRAMFGPAAAAMDRFYAEIDAAVRTTGKAYSDNPPRDVPGLFDPGCLDRARQALTEAQTQAARHPEIRQRIAEVARVFEYGRWMIRCLEAAARFHERAEISDYRAARDAGRRALRFVRNREAEKFLHSLTLLEDLGVPASGLGKAEKKGGRTCWNTDETGKGDGRSGWALLYVPLQHPDRPLELSLEVWGQSDLAGIVINTGGRGKSIAAGGIWHRIAPEHPLSGKPGWETLRFVISPEWFAPGRKSQRVGLGGGDSQIWIARVRVRTLSNQAPASRRQNPGGPPALGRGRRRTR